MYKINNVLMFMSFRGVFKLRAHKFVGDTTGNLHVGPEQLVVVQHPDDLEFLVNVFVYEGGTLILPADFTCYNIKMHIWLV